MVSLSQIVFLLLLRFTHLWAFSSGPPLSTCELMVPHHRGSKPQTVASPYDITPSKNSYIPGENLNVTISGSDFKGFILQAQGSDSSVAWPIGEFVDIPEGAQTLYCSGGEPKNTVTHYNPSKTSWSSRQITWKAPPTSAGNIRFIATIIKTYAKYWVKVASSAITGPPAGRVRRGVSDENFQITKDGCGQTKSCYSEPENCKASSDCNYLVTIKPLKGGDRQGDTEEVEFEVSSNEEWASIGFNKVKKMADTDALICADVNGNVSVDHYVADKGYRRPTKSHPKPSSIVQTLAESAGGVVSCRFRRKKQDPKMIDLTEPLFLVYASGPMNGDSIGKHSSTPKTSAQMVNIEEIGVLGAEEKDTSEIKAHGCLMVIAWVGFASIGIFMARYMKVAFGDKELLGTKIWFTFHRCFMILAVVLTIISIIIIFAHAGRWTDEAGAHPITGIIVLVLAVLQPIMALFRPHPGEENRYIFNWAHRGVGLAALIVAVVTVFLGIRLDHTGLDDSALYAMIAYCVGVGIVIVFDVYLSFERNNKATCSTVAKPDKEGDHVELEPTRDQSIPARKLMLGFLALFVFCVVIALVVLIAGAGKEGAHDHHEH